MEAGELNMNKKVAVLNGRVEHIYHSEDDIIIFDGAKIEERDFEYIDDFGWKEADYTLPITDKERIEQLEKMINMMLKGEI